MECVIASEKKQQSEIKIACVYLLIDQRDGVYY